MQMGIPGSVFFPDPRSDSRGYHRRARMYIKHIWVQSLDKIRLMELVGLNADMRLVMQYAVLPAMSLIGIARNLPRIHRL